MILQWADENSCFLNVIAQTLWHLKPWRDAFLDHRRQIAPGFRAGEVSEALHGILRRYQRGGSREPVISTDELRIAISRLIDDGLNFGEQADAMEVLNQIMNRIHNEDVHAGRDSVAQVSKHPHSPLCGGGLTLSASLSVSASAITLSLRSHSLSLPHCLFL